MRKGLEQRLEMGLGRRPLDFGMAEALAFGGLLWDGIPVRLAGQDSRRGTFNHRHAVLLDFETGEEHVPLHHLHPQQAFFEVHDTPRRSVAVPAVLGVHVVPPSVVVTTAPPFPTATHSDAEGQLIALRSLPWGPGFSHGPEAGPDVIGSSGGETRTGPPASGWFGVDPTHGPQFV